MCLNLLAHRAAGVVFGSYLLINLCLCHSVTSARHRVSPPVMLSNPVAIVSPNNHSPYAELEFFRFILLRPPVYGNKRFNFSLAILLLDDILNTYPEHALPHVFTFLKQFALKLPDIA